MRRAVLLHSMLLTFFLFALMQNLFAQGSPNVPLLATMNIHGGPGYNDCWGYTAPDGREYALLGVQNGTSIVDITDTNNLVEIAFIPSASSLWKDIKTYQHYAYVVTEASGGMQIIDLSDLPNSASVAATYNGFSTSHNIYIDEPTGILLAEGSGGVAVRTISLADPLNPVEISTFGTECHDIVMQDGIVYVSEGGSGSFGVYNLTDPANPQFVATINVPAAGYCHNAWMTADGNYIMTTEETVGKTIKYWDVSDPTNAFITDQVLGANGFAHNAHIKGNFSYVSHYSDGLKIYDISDPNNVFEAGFYDTEPGGSTSDGAWGAYPFFKSGKVIISDQAHGLFVVFFEGSKEGDDEDPNAPDNLVAYSDYTSSSSIDLSWDDPTNFFNGDTLLPGDFTIEIYRDGSAVASVSGGTETYADGGLMDGQLYMYEVFTKVTATDSTSDARTIEWYAGGAPTPSMPLSFTLGTSGGDLVANWTNPSTNEDGTPLDDFAGINLYEDGFLLASFARTSADSGAADSEVFTPSAGTHSYTLTAIDNESPVNESAPSNPAFPPISLPFADDFESGVLNSGWWMNMEATVNQSSINPPSGTYALDLNGNVGGDVVTLFPVDLSGAAGQGYLLSFWVQPEGTLNAPEPGDVFMVEFLNDQGDWIEVYFRAGTGVVPFEHITINIDSAPSGGGSYFYGAFQMRFRTDSGPVGDFDDYFVDNVFLGIPNNPPMMAVTPLAISDTVLAGDTATETITLSNTATLTSSLNYQVTTDPNATWLSVTPTSGVVSTGNSDMLTVTMDASGLSAGSYTSDITISGNDPNNPDDVVTVSFQVNDAPVVGFLPDSLSISVEPGAMDTVVMTITNSGNGPLDFILSDEDVSTVKNHIIPAPRPNYPANYYGMELDKNEQDPRQGHNLLEGEGGPDAFGYTWIDSDEPDGPTYNWVDISSTGTALDVNSPWIATGTFGGNDEGYIEVTLPFAFSFYGISYNSVFIGSNGNVSFQPPTDNTFTNQPIPTAGDGIDNYLAAFVDDLEVDGPGTIYYGMDGSDFVIQYQDMPRFNSTTANYTFQYILKPTGAIMYQYDAMGFGGGNIESATIGIENADGTDGLQIAFNEAYLHDDLAILIAAGATWLDQDPISGTVGPQSQMDINLIVNASGLAVGNYAANIIITSNDPVNSVVYAPVSVNVSVVGIEGEGAVPLTYDISRNYPNPFNPTTSINYQVPEVADVSLVVYNVLGQRVKTLVNTRIQPGKYQAAWDAKNDAGETVGSGIYIYRFEAGKFSKIQKMILLK